MQVKGHHFQTRYFTVITPKTRSEREHEGSTQNESKWKPAFVLTCIDRGNIPAKTPQTMFHSQVCNKFSVSIWTITHSEGNPAPAEASDTLVTALRLNSTLPSPGCQPQREKTITLRS